MLTPGLRGMQGGVSAAKGFPDSAVVKPGELTEPFHFYLSYQNFQILADAH
jgi:hypothetical protein